MKLITAAQMREIDRISIQERGIPAPRLMDLAGKAVAMDLADHSAPASVAILCGKGNNAGDGFVAARYLVQAGWEVAVYYVEEPDPGAGAAREAWEAIPEEVRRVPLAEAADLRAQLDGFDFAVDALLGTGVKGTPRPPFDAIISALNDSTTPVFAVDIPSGLHPDEGTAECAVRAARTITMGLPKLGMVKGDGPAHCGMVRVEPLDFPNDLLDGADSPFATLTPQEARAMLPPRPANGHKGTFGLLVLAAGSAPMPGAAVLAGLGALRGGCGLVRIHTPADVRGIVAAHLPEVIFSRESSGNEFLGHLPDSALADLLESAKALAIGPGLGQQGPTRHFLHQLLSAGELPMVLDADALNLIAAQGELRELLRPNHILTPHPGELARLMGANPASIQKDRWGSARAAARRFGCVVLLKGHGTLVAEPDGTVTHLAPGNTAWAQGGAGDVLTGLIGSLLAQGTAPADAARLGGFLHGMAADIATREYSPRSLIVREVADFLPTAFRELERA